MMRWVGLLLPFGIIFASHAMPSTNTAEKLRLIANDYEQAYFETFPELGLFWGKSDIAQDKFSDHSLAGLKAWQQRQDDFLEALNTLSEDSLKGSAEFITYQLLKQNLETAQAIRVCKEELWSVSPLWGWHNVLTEIAEKQPVGTPLARQQALKRWQTVDKMVVDEIANLRIGLKEGYTAPKPAVQRVLLQLDILLETPVEKSPFLAFAHKDGDTAFIQQMTIITTNEIYPALKRYADFLKNEYLSQARDSVGVSSLPHAKECYAAKIKNETTLNISAEEIHQFGLSHMQQIMQEVASIGSREFGITDITAVFKMAKEHPQSQFQSEADILAYNETALESAKSKVNEWFSLMPKAPATIKPYPLHRAKTGAAGEYHPPSEDGERPGIFYINTYEPHKKNRVDQEATLFHELIPGHHFQVALSMEDKSQHSLNKYLWNAGYGEGWALYCERLADEMNLYRDEISRLGMLSNEALRTARLVVDPGIHVMNWSRQQAIDYLKQHTALEEHIIEAEVDRYIMLPGQATAYMLGKREIESLRQVAKNQLGERFDIRAFHDQVLKNGAVTLPMLRAQVEDWLTATS